MTIQLSYIRMPITIAKKKNYEKNVAKNLTEMDLNEYRERKARQKYKRFFFFFSKFPHIKHTCMGSSCCAQWVKNLTSIHDDVGSTPGLAHWVKDPALLQAAV